MANENVAAQVELAMKDQAFVDQLSAAQSAEEAQKIFASKGIDFTLEEVKAIALGVEKGDELGEEELEAVSGGSITLAGIWTVVKIVGGVVTIVDTIRKWKW